MNHSNSRNCRAAVVAALCSLLSLAGCGGGGSGSAASNAVTSAATGKDLAQGTVTGFGSVYLGGEKYDTGDAAFYDDDRRVDQDDLAVGMRVRLAGDFDDDEQRADIVSYNEDVKGPVDEVNGDTLTVLGQTVHVVPDTVLDDGLDLAAVQPGDILEVSGYRGADDVIEASYLELQSPDDVDEYEVVGRIREFDASAREFLIGGLRVSYAAARLDDVGPLAEGVLVEVEDESLGYVPGSFTLEATEVEAESATAPRELDDDDRIGGTLELEGLIAEVVDAGTFRIDGIDVHHDAVTVFVYGSAVELAAGVKVEVKGQLVDEQTVRAARIKFARNTARVSAPVEMVNLDENAVVAFGITLVLAEDAELEDGRDGRSPFTLADLMPGDFIDAEGYFAHGVLVTRGMEREASDDDTEIRGVAGNVYAEAGTLDILGVSITAGPNTEFEADDDGVLGAQAFFALLSDGQTLVEAKWRGPVSDPSVVVDELELEDDDFEPDDDDDDNDNDDNGNR